MQRYGVRLSDTKWFVATNDPRQRELNDVRLLTQGTGYDVVLVVDITDEIGRGFTYRTVLPRPVVGSTGLTPSSWFWALERFGAPQLEQRFERLVDGRGRMDDAEYGAWLAVRAVIEAHAQAYARDRSTDFNAVVSRLRSPDFKLDIYKGVPASFRPWDNQLRQPVLLHTGDAVIATAPIEGFLHASDNLDTLGTDRSQSRCRM